MKYISHVSYEERFKHLGLPRLEYRRGRADIVQLYKIIKQTDNVDIANCLHLHLMERSEVILLNYLNPELE